MTTATRNSRNGERGIVTFMSAMLLLCLTIPVVGLAIDAGTLYAIKARLQAAVDAASLSAARSFNEGLTITSQQTAGASAATRWFHSDLPNNWMGVGTVSDPTVTFPTAPAETIIVNVVGSVTAPTYFMNIFNIHSLTFSATGQATRRFANIMLVIDRSGSIYQSSSCTALATAAQSFVNNFVNGQDRLGMITFGTDYAVDFPPSYNFASSSPSMSSMLGNLYCYGYTNSGNAYWQAYQQLVALNDPGALNVIVFFTDGVPNTITFGGSYTLPAKTQANSAEGSFSDPYGNGFNTANPSTCKDSNGKVSGQSGWSPGPFSGVLTPLGSLYLPDAPSYPASIAVDAQKIGSAQGDYGGCAIDTYFSNNEFVYSDGSPSRQIVGPGFLALFDVAYIPSADVNGNLTGTGYNSTSVYQTVATYPSGPWSGQIRIDAYPTCTGSCVIAINDQISLVGENVLDNAAQRVRAESSASGLNVYTYTIGLGNAPGGVDNTLLERVANDSSAPNYNSSLPVGEYVYAPTASELNQAFTEIASQVLRLSK